MELKELINKLIQVLEAPVNPLNGIESARTSSDACVIPSENPINGIERERECV